MSEVTLKKYQIKKVLGGLLLIGIMSFLLTSLLQFNSITLANPSNSQNNKKTILTGETKQKLFIALLSGGLASIVTIYVNNKESNLQKRERLIESLTWLEGRTQRRNIGIAIVESGWNLDENQDFHLAWTSILVNQAIYLLTNEKDQDQDQDQGKHKEKIAFHEKDNLCRIIDILVEKAKFPKIAKKDEFYLGRYKFLILAIENHVENRKNKKLETLNEDIKRLKKNKENWKKLINNEELWNNFINGKNSEESS
ncbi:hypothetical protein [Crocosphaera sp.]|uniref:hypothetical protein n=1 Tax=Crocosphaera sp. TaxID=2729996 RepID=UPI003F21B17C|nr:hypothetical protein [Crocosphaera sp.]